MLHKTLENIGWSDKEAAIYIALLSHGSLIISDISKYSKINRVTVYDTIGKLINIGAVSYTLKNSRKFYTATNPEYIYKIQEQKLTKFSKALDEFKALAANKKTKTVRFFEGNQSTNLLYQDMQASNNQIIKCFLAPQRIVLDMPDIVHQFIEKRIQSNIVVHAVMPDLPYTQFYLDNQDQSKRIVKVVPSKKFNFKTSFYCTNSKVYIIDFENQVSSILIDDKQISESLEAIFDMCWEFL